MYVITEIILIIDEIVETINSNWRTSGLQVKVQRNLSQQLLWHRNHYSQPVHPLCNVKISSERRLVLAVPRPMQLVKPHVKKSLIYGFLVMLHKVSEEILLNRRNNQVIRFQSVFFYFLKKIPIFHFFQYIQVYNANKTIFN